MYQQCKERSVIKFQLLKHFSSVDVVADNDGSDEVNKRLFTQSVIQMTDANSVQEDDSSNDTSGNALNTVTKEAISASTTSAVKSNNSAGRTPLGLLQAKQCRTLEEEFTKNQRTILNQLDQSDENTMPVVPSTTQFVEQI